MEIERIRLIGLILGLVGVIISIIRLIFAFPLIPVWLNGKNISRIIAAILLIVILLAWIIALIGIPYAYYLKKGTFLMAAGIMQCSVLIFALFYRFDSTVLNAYNFFVPLELLFYLAGGILFTIARIQENKGKS